MSVLSELSLKCYQVFMGFPVKYTSGSATGRRLTFSSAVFWAGFTVTILQTGLLSVSLSMDVIQGFVLNSNTKTTQFAREILHITTILTEVVMFYTCARKYSKFFDVCNTLGRLGRFDSSLQLAPPDSWMTIKVTALITILTVTPFISEGNYLYRVVHLAKDGDIISQPIIAFICFMAANCRHICVLIQFQEVTQCIAKRFRLINAKIKQEIIVQSCCQPMGHQNLPYTIHVQEQGSSNRINFYMSAYHMLRDAVDQANAFYCDILMSAIFYKFVHVTIALYILFLYLMYGNPIALVKSGIWIYCHISFLLLVVSSSSDVTQAAGETAQIICKLINRDLEPILQRQLESFLMQLDVQTVEFSARGYFKISRQLLTTIAASVTTSLVILLQFNAQF